MTDQTELMSVTLAARRFGVSEPTFRRRVRERALPLFADPRDRRRKLVRVADVDGLALLEPMGPGGPEGGA